MLSAPKEEADLRKRVKNMPKYLKRFDVYEEILQKLRASQSAAVTSNNASIFALTGLTEARTAMVSPVISPRLEMARKLTAPFIEERRKTMANPPLLFIGGNSPAQANYPKLTPAAKKLGNSFRKTVSFWDQSKIIQRMAVMPRMHEKLLSPESTPISPKTSIMETLKMKPASAFRADLKNKTMNAIQEPSETHRSRPVTTNGIASRRSQSSLVELLPSPQPSRKDLSLAKRLESSSLPFFSVLQFECGFSTSRKSIYPRPTTRRLHTETQEKPKSRLSLRNFNLFRSKLL